ncbi:MAG TPA: hypothetical protein VGN52_02760 [Burkholderiales bacterium]
MEESLPIYKRTHPMVPIAAASVIVMSLIGIGVFTGIIPTHMNSEAQSPAAYSASASAPQAVAGSAAADGNAAGNAGAPLPPLPNSQAYAPPPPYPSSAPAASPAPAVVPAPAAAADCYACGHVESVRATEVQGRATGVGAVAGGVGGALIGNTIAHRRDRGPLTILGAVGGAFAGNAIEKHVRKHVVYQVHVRMDDGSLRTFSAASAGAYSSGERVRVENGGLVPIG